MKRNRPRWIEIAKEFKKETQNNPSGTLNVIEHEKDTSITTFNGAPFQKNFIEAITFNSTIDELLNKYDNKTFAKKLVELFNMGNKAGKQKNKAYEKYQKLIDDNFLTPKEHFIELREQEFEKIENSTKEKANKDSFLENFCIFV